MTIDEMISVLTAAKEGKAIEWRCKTGNRPEWYAGAPAWDFCQHDYRVKPEPREIWVNEYDGWIAAHIARDVAIRSAGSGPALRKAVHFREVLP